MTDTTLAAVLGVFSKTNAPPFPILHWAGIPVIVSSTLGELPVLQVSPGFEWITEECRARTNAWLLERFGTREVMYKVEKDFAGRGPYFIVSTKTAAKLRERLRVGI